MAKSRELQELKFVMAAAGKSVVRMRSHLNPLTWYK